MNESFNIAAHLGDGEFGFDTLEANFPSVPYFAPFPDWPLNRLAIDDIDVMYCAPPCAPWSAGGGQGKKLDTDPRVAKVGHALSAGWAVEPTIWVMESVTGFPARSPDMIRMMEEAFTERGYAVTHFYSNYLLHDTPQNRNRYHFIAHRVPLTDPEMVAVNIGHRGDDLPVVADYLPPDRPKKSEIFSDASFRKFAGIVEEHVPQGHRVRKVFRDLAGLEDGEPGGPSFNLYRLRPDYPASTMISSPRIIHPNGKRIITVKEAMAISRYPEDYVVVGRNEEKRYRELGKGVLPEMAHFLGDWFADSLVVADELFRSKKARKAFRPVIEVIDWRDDARKLLRQKPPAYPFPKEKRGSMPELKGWYMGRGRTSSMENDDSEEDE